MKRARTLMVVVPALSLVLASGAFAGSQQMEHKAYNPAPSLTVESEMPPPSATDVQSEKINRKSTSHLEEYQERDQGVPTGVSSDTQGSETNRMNRRAPDRAHKNSSSR